MLTKIAEKYGTPCYVYDKQILEANFKHFARVFKHIRYAVKANSNIAILSILAQLNAGFDIVSGGELMRVLKAGGDPQKIVFSGVGKQDDEIRQALAANIGCFNVESAFELDQLNAIAQSLHKTAPIALRINPDISIQAHPYISTGLKESKFGIPYEEALQLYCYAQHLPCVAIKGIACHLGSQNMEAAPYVAALDKLLNIITNLKYNNIKIKYIDIGGGFGIGLDIAALAQKMEKLTAPYMPIDLMVEPGRAIAASSGVLLTKVISLKRQGDKHFAIVDAAMNDLLRPALYDAWHDVVPVIKREGELFNYDIVGPVCETGDFLAKNRQLCLQPQDLLTITMAGAYGFVMSSNYNARPRAAEVLIDHDKVYIIRERERLSDLIAGEKGLC